MAMFVNSFHQPPNLKFNGKTYVELFFFLVIKNKIPIAHHPIQFNTKRQKAAAQVTMIRLVNWPELSRESGLKWKRDVDG